MKRNLQLPLRRPISALVGVAAVLFFVAAVAGVGRAVDVTATVDRNRVAPGEPVVLTVAVSGGPGEVDTSAIRDFDILGSATSTQIQIVNGQMSKSISRRFTLMPKRIGELQIPPLAVTSEGTNVTTPAITVHVAKGSESGPADDDILVKAAVNNAEPYEGEQIVYTFRFHQAVQADNIRLSRPGFEGFSAREIEEKKQYTTVISGRQYRVTELYVVLTPLGAGERTIAPAVLQCHVAVDGQGRTGAPSLLNPLLDDPFFGRSRFRQRVIETDPVPVRVKPLPPYAGTADYSGLVGTFEMSAGVDRAEWAMGDSATLSVTLRGTGNIMDAEAPAVAASDAFKVYPDTPEETVGFSDQGFSGTRVFRYALVGLKPGRHTVEPVRLSYFDVQADQYRTLETGAIPVRILAGGAQQAGDAPAPSSDSPAPPAAGPQAVTFTGHDILPVKSDPDALVDRPQIPLSGFILWLAGPGVLYLAYRVAAAYAGREIDTATRMARRAQAALKSAAAAGGDPDLFLAHLESAVISGVRSVSGTRGTSLTETEIDNLLGSAGFDGRTVEAATGIMRRIGVFRYSGGTMDAAAGDALLADTRRLVYMLCG